MILEVKENGALSEADGFARWYHTDIHVAIRGHPGYILDHRSVDLESPGRNPFTRDAIHLQSKLPVRIITINRRPGRGATRQGGPEDSRRAPGVLPGDPRRGPGCRWQCFRHIHTRIFTMCICQVLLYVYICIPGTAALQSAKKIQVIELP